MKSKKGCWIGIGVLVVLAFLSIISLIWLFVTAPDSVDKLSADDSDLDFPPRQIDPRQNPYPSIRQWVLSEEKETNAKRALSMLRGKEEIDPVFTAKVIADFRSEFEQFNQFAAMTDWKYDGRFHDATDTSELNTIRMIAMLNRYRIRDLFETGETDLAIDETIRHFKLGQHLQAAEGTLIYLLVGLAISDLGNTILLEAIEAGRFDQAHLKHISDELQAQPIKTTDMANAFRAEYKMYLSMLDDLAEGKIPNTKGYKVPDSFLFRREHSKRLAAQATRQMIKEIDLIRKEAPRNATRQIEEMNDNRLKLFTSGNAVGYILLSVWAPAYESISDSFARHQIKRDLVQLRIAIERYRLREGKLPDSLAELTPDLMAKVPIDLMDGKPLRYLPTENPALIYSIGQDFIDQKGQSKRPEPLRDKNEIVIRIER